MHFRLKAFALHLIVSMIVLGAVLGIFYVGWYAWPGWYLADVSQVVLVMVGVDWVAGPLLTFVIADATKLRRSLRRDVSVIAALQIAALLYGSLQLWNGRPLYYAFSENVLQLVQAYDINAAETRLARQQGSEFAPNWYSLPRWIWAPLPANQQERDKIVASAISGGDDVISMPRYYKRWKDGIPLLRMQLKKVDDVGYFFPRDKARLKDKLVAAGYSPDLANAIPLSGRGPPLLAVFDPASVNMQAIFTGK